jgi:activating signal cointegrator 1
MRCISLWQPYATLLLYRNNHGMRYKAVETRPFPAPSTVLGQRIGIASTKILKPEQRACFDDPAFQAFYQETGFPALDKLDHGYLLGTVHVYDCELMTEESIEDVTDEEKAYGDWRPGRFAWRTKDPEVFKDPIPVSGQQGIWIYNVPAYMRRVK